MCLCLHYQSAAKRINIESTDPPYSSLQNWSALHQRDSALSAPPFETNAASVHAHGASQSKSAQRRRSKLLLIKSESTLPPQSPLHNWIAAKSNCSALSAPPFEMDLRARARSQSKSEWRAAGQNCCFSNLKVLFLHSHQSRIG